MTVPRVVPAPPPAGSFPRRHGGDQERARLATDRFLARLPPGERPTVSPAEAALCGRGLLLGDPPADALVAWMRAGGADARARVHRGIDGGLAALPDAPPGEADDGPLRAFLGEVEARPAWVRDDQLVDGARVCNRGGVAAMRALLVTGLLAGYQLAAVNQTLLATGALEKGAARRLAETTQWWVAVTRPGAMARGAEGWRATLHVRLVHAVVRRQVASFPDWDAADLGLPVNQTDMQATAFGFGLVYLLGMDLVGVRTNPAERAAVLHLWRYIAWLMGVQEPFLPALDDLERSATAMFSANLLHQRMADADSARLARALADEPLARRYPSAAGLRGRYNRSLQLSIARVCLHPDALRDLGLTDAPRVPWYPLVRAPANLVTHALARRLPGGRAWLSERGARRQEAYLALLAGGGPAPARA